MTHPDDERRSTRRTRGAVLLSALAGVAAVAAALVGPGLAGDPPRPRLAAAAAPADAAARESGRAQAALVAAEDRRLLDLVRAVPHGAAPYLERATTPPTLVLTPAERPYDLAALLDRGAAVRVDEEAVDLVASVLVAPGAALELDAPGTTLRMTSGADGFASIVGWQAPVSLTGAPGRPLTVRGWDTDAGTADRTVEDGRPYVRVVGDRLRTADVALAGLGFWSGRTGGLALTGSDGRTSTGSVTATSVDGGHYGLYSEDSVDLVVEDSRFSGSAADGILLHRGSTGATVRSTIVRDSAAHGIAVGRGAADVTLEGVQVESSAADGIRIDGRPLAEEPGPAGLSLDGFSGFRVVDSAVRAPGGSGIVVWAAHEVELSRNEVAGGTDGIVVRGAAHRVVVRANSVSGAAGAGIAVRDGVTAGEVTANTVAGAATGVQVRDAVAAVRRTTVTGATLHGLSFQGAAAGSSAAGNVLGGRGTSSVDVARLAPGVAVALSGTRDEGWEQTVPEDRWVHALAAQPLLGLWGLALLVPVLATALARRRRRDRARPPYDPPRGAVPVPPAATPPPEPSSATRLTVVGAAEDR